MIRPGVKSAEDPQGFIGNYLTNEGQYGLAMQFSNYRAGARFAIAALRRLPSDPGGLWRVRLNGCLRRRHG